MNRSTWKIARVTALGISLAAATISAADEPSQAVAKRPSITIRGIYGGVPQQVFDRGESLEDYGINAIWIGSGGATPELIASLKARSKSVKVFAEFNTMHEAGYLKDHPDAAPVGADGKVSPPPDDWQGICPTHSGYRQSRMEAFRKLIKAVALDGVWLDYHHSHANWEQPKPNMPDTCFCDRCVAVFQKQTQISLTNESAASRARKILESHKAAWVQWRCDVFTDWVREFRKIIDQERPHALLGTFHCPWSGSDFDGALRQKLAIDLKAQAKYLDVFSIMPYHARFGHSHDPAWISRQTAALGQTLGIKGEPGERLKIWPIVQLSDWGETVPVSQVKDVLDHGTRAPSTGVMIFAWGFHSRWEKVEAMREFYRAIQPAT
jgi:hypothetical protein